MFDARHRICASIFLFPSNRNLPYDRQAAADKQKIHPV